MLDRAIVARGNSWRIALAEWLLAELDQPAETPPPAGPREYRMQEGSDIHLPDEVFVRVFYTPARTEEELTRLLTAMRAKVRAPRSTIIPARRAIVVRGNAELVAAAERALAQMQ